MLVSQGQQVSKSQALFLKSCKKYRHKEIRTPDAQIRAEVPSRVLPEVLRIPLEKLILLRVHRLKICSEGEVTDGQVALPAPSIGNSLSKSPACEGG